MPLCGGVNAQRRQRKAHGFAGRRQRARCLSAPPARRKRRPQRAPAVQRKCRKQIKQQKQQVYAQANRRIHRVNPAHLAQRAERQNRREICDRPSGGDGDQSGRGEVVHSFDRRKRTERRKPNFRNARVNELCGDQVSRFMRGEREHQHDRFAIHAEAMREQRQHQNRRVDAQFVIADGKGHASMPIRALGFTGCWFSRSS